MSSQREGSIPTRDKFTAHSRYDVNVYLLKGNTLQVFDGRIKACKLWEEDMES